MPPESKRIEKHQFRFRNWLHGHYLLKKDAAAAVAA
jgi:hypothetical protein